MSLEQEKAVATYDYAGHTTFGEAPDRYVDGAFQRRGPSGFVAEADSAVLLPARDPGPDPPLAGYSRWISSGPLI
jgi:hypothetical protein